MSLGQPPRTKSGEYDKRELEVWFEQVWREVGKTSSSGSTTGGSTISTWVAAARSSAEQAAAAVLEAQALLNEIQNTQVGTGGTSKRYLRWMQL